MTTKGDRVKIGPEMFADPDQLGAAAAEIVADGIADARAAGRPFLLGCPGGRSPLSTYQALAGLAGRRGLDLSRLVIVMMDEYLVPADRSAAGPADPPLVREDPDQPHSCLRFARDQIVGPLNAAVPEPNRMADNALWIPDPADPDHYDDQIAAAGGVDLFLLACGASDGHIAFNGPGSARGSRTRVVDLPDTTRVDNLATFPSFGNDLARVPRQGITAGIATIADQARQVIMLVHGADKAIAAGRLCAATEFDDSWPATCFVENRSPRLFLDRAAAAAATESASRS